MNLRRFAETPVVRRAINVIKDRIAAMDWQVERLSTAGKSGWAGLMGEFHELRQVCMALMTLTGESSEVIQERLVRLYAAHVAEWRVFPPRHLLVTQRKAA